jgi:hypothetical protein
MAVQQAFFTNEGEALFASMLFKNDSSIRPANLELLLFTNLTVSEATKYVDLTEPTGGSYARKTLVDANWTVANGVFSYPQQTFTPIGASYTGAIQGAAIVTKGASPKVLFIVTDPVAPVTLTAGTPYIVAANVACNPVTKGNTEFFLNLLLKNEMSSRGTGLQAVLFTNPDNITAKVLADLSQPTSVGGYLAEDILDSAWSIVTTTGDAVANCPAITFTPTGALFSAEIVGYAITTKTAPNYVVSIEADPASPVALPLNTPYIITPSIKIM